MKWAASLMLSLLTLSISSLANAQTVSGRAPVVVPAQYVSSSSPTSDGRIVRMTNTTGSDRTVTVIAEPYRVPKGATLQGNSSEPTGWRTIEPRYVVTPASSAAPTSATLPKSSAKPPQPVAPTVSRYPVSSTAVPPTVVYYVQDSSGQVMHASGGSATSSPTGIYQVLGAETEVTQPPVIQCPSPSIAAPTAVVPVNPPNTIYKPVLPLRLSIEGAYVSRGIWGQPKAYVPREPVRNFFRYILP